MSDQAEYLRRQRAKHGGRRPADVRYDRVVNRAKSKLVRMARAGEFGDDLWRNLIAEARAELSAEGRL